MRRRWLHEAVAALGLLAGVAAVALAVGHLLG